MKIVNGRRVYQRDLKKLTQIDNDGWDSYDGRNEQRYTLSAAILDDGAILYELAADNSGCCYGNYQTIYRVGGDELLRYVADTRYCANARDEIAELLGDIEEPISELMQAVLTELKI